MGFKYKISVIVPVYNTEKHIEEMLSSLANQTIDKYEIILVDDGSTDNSAEIINKYIKNNDLKNVRYIYQSNSGPSRARNNGLDLAKGEYVCFVDADDKLPVDALDLMYEKGIENDASIVLGGTYRFNSEKEWKVNSHFFEEGFKDIRKFNKILWSMGPCNKIYRKTLLDGIRFPEDMTYGEDQYFVMKAYLKAGSIYTIDELVYYYREQDVEGGSLTSKEVTNPNYVLKQVVELWKRTSESIDDIVENKYDREYIKIHYLNRLINVNVWNPVKNALDTKKSKEQQTALKYILEMIESVDSNVFTEVFVFHRLCTAWIIDRYLLLDSESKKIYFKIVEKMFENLNSNGYAKILKKYPILVPVLLDSTKGNAEYKIKRYLIKRKLKKKKVDREEKLKISLRNPILKIGGIIKPVDKNKLILATNKSDKLTGNLAFIEAEAKKMVQGLEVKYYGKKKRNLKETLKMYWDFSNAGNIVIDDYYNQLYNANLNKNINLIQVWHACGAFKKFGFSAMGYNDSNSEEFETKAHSHYTHSIVSAEEIAPHYSEAFRIDISKVVPLGVPRTDIFFDEEYKSYVKERFLDKYPKLDGKKLVLYAPTFRGNAAQRKVFNLELDLEYWCNNMPEDYMLILKMHPSVAKKVAVPKEYADRVIDLSAGVVEDLLIVSDVLISDYSSVVFEFALLNKPIIFFAYDLDNYMDERNFYYKYEDFVPGKIVKTTEDIVDIIVNEDYDMDRMDMFRNKFFNHFDGKSSKRFCEKFLK